MSRRVSSKDDLFLSAADMYTLLTFVFLGLAFVRLPSSTGTPALLDLPVVARGTGPAGNERPLVVRWAEGSLSPPSLSGVCKLVIDSKPEALEGSLPDAIDVPCAPAAYLGEPSGPVSAAQATLRSLAEVLPEPRRVAVLQCPTQRSDPKGAATEPLLACARLQWVLLEVGFRAAALVRSGGTGAP